MTDIYILTARERTTYQTKPTKILRAFTNEILATEAKLLIEDCEPRLEVEVVTVPLVGVITASPGPSKPFVMDRVFGGPRYSEPLIPHESNVAVQP